MRTLCSLNAPTLRVLFQPPLSSDQLSKLTETRQPLCTVIQCNDLFKERTMKKIDDLVCDYANKRPAILKGIRLKEDDVRNIELIRQHVAKEYRKELNFPATVRLALRLTAESLEA